jgi:hypothetical protein
MVRLTPWTVWQDCNLVLYGNGQPTFTSGTNGLGYPPCRLVVSGAGGAGIAVLDSTNAVLYVLGIYSPPGTPYGVMPVGAVLHEVSATEVPRMQPRDAIG